MFKMLDKLGETMNKLGKCAVHGPRNFQRPAVLVSFFALVLLATTVSGGTIPNRRTGVIETGSLDSNIPKSSQKMHPTHPAFANAGQRKGIEIWRIENFEPVRYPAKDYGKFYTGDSYIILDTKENKNKDLSWDIHFWLGSETSNDEAGAAAILSVQLDDMLNGDPIQHREVQDHEGPLFLSYFKNVDVVGEEKDDDDGSNGDGGGDASGKGSGKGSGSGAGDAAGNQAADNEAAAEGGGDEAQPEDAEAEAEAEPEVEPEPEPEPEPEEGPEDASEPADEEPRQTGGEVMPTESIDTYRIRRPHGSYRIPPYSAELITPSKLFRRKHRLSKEESKVSLEKVSSSKSALDRSLRPSLKGPQSGEKVQHNVSYKSLGSDSRQSKIKNLSNTDEQVLVDSLLSGKSKRNSVESQKIGMKRMDGSVSSKDQVSHSSNDRKIKTSSELATMISPDKIKLVNISNDALENKKKPPMDDSAAKVAKNLPKPTKVSKKDDGNVERRSSLSLQLPTGDGIRYEKGGVASGFRHTEVNAQGQKRLFQVKGKRNVRVRQVNLSISSMNRGDCFILDAGNAIYVYVGSSAKRVEKLKAISAANQIRDQDHHGRAKVHIIDDFSNEFDAEEFFTILGSGSPSQVPAESVAEDDAEFEKNDERAVTLYKISDESGSLKVDTISQKPLRQDMLDNKDCFILDTGSGIFVWVGKGATQQEKTQAMAKAQGFIQVKKYPAWTNIERIVEGAESAPFKQYFSTWRDVGMAHTRLIRAANDNDSDTAEDEEFDPAVLHALKKSGGRAIGFMPDNGEGRLEAMYRIENFELVEISPEMYGMLFGGDSYVIKYHYINKRGGQGYILYYWLGSESSIDEKASAALHTVRLDNELNGTAVQVRVVQGFEPRHFLKVFKGKLITFTGGHASGFRRINDPETYERSGNRLFRVRGTCQEDVRADQRPAVASSLASDDMFVLETPKKVYIWKGVGASDFERDMAASVVKRIAPSEEHVRLNEGSETSEFWEALGGEGAYDKILDSVYPPFLEPRLFHCRILANGRFKVEEINHFEQEDLDVDDIMVLDGGDEVYVWIGDGSTEEEREKSIDMAKHYILTDPSHRSEETVPLVKVRQGHEPRSFKRLFPAWDDDVWQSIPSYESLKEKILEANRQIDNEVQ